MKETNISGFCRIWDRISKVHEKSFKIYFMVDEGNWTPVYQKNQLGIGEKMCRNGSKMGQKWHFMA